MGGSTFDAPELWIGDGSIFNLDGLLTGTLTNSGSKVAPAGREVGTLLIDGNLIHQNQSKDVPSPIGVLSFDIADKFEGYYDKINVAGFADMTSAIELRWNGLYTPSSGDAYDLLSVGTAAGEPSVVYCAGLPSDLVCRWTTPTNFRGGSEVVVETTGPILFDSGTSTSVATTPNEIVVADLDGINGPDVAMTMSDAGGGAGNVLVLLTNGMSGNIWFIRIPGSKGPENPRRASRAGTSKDVPMPPPLNRPERVARPVRR